MRFAGVFSFLFAVTLIASFTACSNDFELTEGSVDIPIVYGTISVGDSATYIRVERAFVDEETSAYVLSKDPAKLYYDNVTVRIIHVKTGKAHNLDKVDGNKEGYQREPGAFADAPNFLYKIKRSALNFIAGDQYRLEIVKNDGNIITSATTTAIAPYKNEDLTNPGPTALLSFVNNLDFKLRWFGDSRGVIHDVTFVFNIKEEIGGKITDKSVSWRAVKNYEKTEYAFKGREFYEFMQGAFDKDPSIKRYFQNASIVLHSGGQEIRDYISIGQANLGITSSGEIPVYTNLSNGAQGLFSSTTRFSRTDIGLAQVTLDSLRNGVLTKSLNFQ